MLSLASNPTSMSDMVLIQNLMQYVEDDQNLNMLPDAFKRLAVQTMFEDAKRLEHEQEQGIDTSNKRLRSVTEEMIE